jgi:hypothetical protein
MGAFRLIGNSNFAWRQSVLFTLGWFGEFCGDPPMSLVSPPEARSRASSASGLVTERRLGHGRRILALNALPVIL